MFGINTRRKAAKELEQGIEEYKKSMIKYFDDKYSFGDTLDVPGLEGCKFIAKGTIYSVVCSYYDSKKDELRFVSFAEDAIEKQVKFNIKNNGKKD